MRSFPSWAPSAYAKLQTFVLNVEALHWFNVDPENLPSWSHPDFQSRLPVPGGAAIQRFRQACFERERAVGRGMLRQHAAARRCGEGNPPSFRQALQGVEHVVGTSRQNDLAIGREKGVDAVPDI